MKQVTNQQLPDIQEMSFDNFSVVFTDHYSALYNYAFSFLRDQEKAKDMVSDVFLKIWVRRKELKVRISLKSYLFAALKNQALLELSRNKKMMLESDAYFLDFNISAYELSPLEKYILDESAAELERIIKELPSMRQEIIELKLFGFTNYEIGEVLSITEKKVDYNYKVALEQLRFKLKKQRIKDIGESSNNSLINS